jgi:hypothetical protein
MQGDSGFEANPSGLKLVKATRMNGIRLKEHHIHVSGFTMQVKDLKRFLNRAKQRRECPPIIINCAIFPRFAFPVQLQ